MSKYAKKVYACPFCWAAVELGKKPKVPVYCSKDKTWIKPGEMIIFDSISEHRVGKELKVMELDGIIQNLKHHEKFELIPKIWFSNPLEGAYYRIVTVKDMNIITEIPHQYGFYESDFSFTQDDKKRVIEVKHITKKKKTGYYRDPITKEKVKATQAINWPFFTPRDPLSHFRLKCQLMKAITHIDVEIWAGDKRFKFDGKWKLVEVQK